MLLLSSINLIGQTNYEVDTILLYGESIAKLDVSEQGTIVYITAENQQIGVIPPAEKQLDLTDYLEQQIGSNSTYTDIGISKNGNIYIGTDGQFLYQYKSDSLLQLEDQAGILSAYVNSIYTKGEEVFIGTANKGYHIDDAGIISTYYPEGEGAYEFFYVGQDNPNQLFKVRSSGISYIWYNGYQTIHYSVFNYLPTDTFYTGVPYEFTTSRTLSYVSFGGNSGIKVDDFNGLSDIRVNKIIEYDGKLVAGTPLGLYKGGFQYSEYGEVPLCETFAINDMVAWKDTLWLATNKGIVKIIKAPLCSRFELTIQYDKENFGDSLWIASSSELTYNWFYEGQELVGFSGNKIPSQGFGLYQAIAENCFNCRDTTHFRLENTVALNPELNAAPLIKIYPNPTSEEVTFQLDHFHQNNLQLTVFDFQGQAVYAQKQIKKAQILNITHWQPGIYLFVFENQQGVYTKKLLKVR